MPRHNHIEGERGGCARVGPCILQSIFDGVAAAASAVVVTLYETRRTVVEKFGI